MSSLLIKNALLVNEGQVQPADILIRNDRIEKIASSISSPAYRCEEIDALEKHLFPGVIDDQVHFREPGLTHKATIYSEARAAVAGGVTSFMEMPNTKPQAVTQALLEEKYQVAARTSLANYSFYMGATNDNLEELKRTDKKKICGVKVFMGSSTGNMLVDNTDTLQRIFSEIDHLVAIHSESEEIIRSNTEKFREQYGDNIPMHMHPQIRNEEACYVSTERAIRLAKQYDTRLHVLHISTADELPLFDNTLPIEKKRITAEVCVHHLWFDEEDYEALGGLIKCNPAIKNERHKKALLQALLDDRLDVIATDHAPHTWEEKQNTYMSCPSGLPLVQHGLQMMLEFYQDNKISLPGIAEKMSHAVAECFRLNERGYIREGYKADLVLVDLNHSMKVSKENIYYKGGWSPLEGTTFRSRIDTTIVNGNIVFRQGNFNESWRGERLLFH